MSSTGQTAIAILTSALANIEGFAGGDQDAARRYVDDARELMAAHSPTEVGLVMLKLGSIGAALLDELARERETDAEGLLRQVAVMTSARSSES